MKATEFEIKASDGHVIPGTIWEPAGRKKKKAVVVIAHGMGEHHGRYARLAEQLVKAGYAVSGHDHRGHGKAENVTENRLYFGDDQGWLWVVEDTSSVIKHMKAKYPKLPVILLGHSMGSYISQQVAITHSDELDALVLCSSGAETGLLGKAGYVVANIEALRLGRKGRSPILHGMSFESFNKQMDNPRGDYEWLTRDAAEQDAYDADPLCGEIATAGMWIDLLGGIMFLEKPQNRGMTPKNLPIYLLAGSNDPSNHMADGARELGRAYMEANIEDVYLKVYPDARHELFNEINRDEVTEDLIKWLDGHAVSRERIAQ